MRYADATSNPTLIIKAISKGGYDDLIEDAINSSALIQPHSKQLEYALDKVNANFGTALSKVVPGYVSTEIDARLSYDTQATICRAMKLIQIYEDMGVSRSRILVKIASTWEGINAARELEKMGIHCNMTLQFSLIQAVCAAQAGVTVISPFVGNYSLFCFN